ncbi:MAG: hypothetical protein [Bacteriophage sp.]|nr:MAG: hypothetical protein [Bacteriophage sp.]
MADKGHNSKLTDDEKKALFFHHVRKEIDIAAQIKELQNIRKSQRKTAQADGITLAKLDFAIKAMAAEEKENVVDAETNRLEVLSWLNLAPGFQADLFEDTAPALDRVKKDGERAGLLGKDGKSQYLEGTEEDTAWLEGWRNGQAVLAKNFESARAKLSEPDDETDDDPFPDNDDEATSLNGAVLQ